MNFRTFASVLFFITFHSYNLMAQEIAIDIPKLKYSIDENITISYSIEKTLDSVTIENKNFQVVNRPSSNTKPNYTEVTYVLKAFKPGRVRLPRVFMYSKDGVKTSNDLFVEIIDKELTSQDLQLIPLKAGYSFRISLPAYMSRTSGINSFSAIEYKSEKDDVQGYVIFDHKKNSNLPESYSATSYYEEIIKDYLIDEPERKISDSQFLKKGEINFIETDLTIFDSEKKKKIYYFIGIAETKKAFYRFISWTPEENKAKIKADFQNILYSIKD